MKHTKGPWKFDENNFDKTITANNKIYHGVIVFDEGCFECEEGIANARLIAAAPEMLEALIMVKKYGDSGYIEGSKPDIEFWFKIDNIIEKATGLKIEEVLKCTE